MTTMVGMIDEILSGRIFGRLANLSLGRKTRTQASNISQSFTKTESQDSKTKRHANNPPEACVLSNIRSIDTTRSSQAIDSQESSHARVRSSTVPAPAPTTESDRCLEDGLLGSEPMDVCDANEVNLPQELIDTWNHAFHCSRKIETRERRLNMLHDKVLYANNEIEDFESLLAHGAQPEDLNVHIQAWADIRGKAVKDINRLEEKILVNRGELPGYEQSFLETWEEIMGSNDLICAPSSASEASTYLEEGNTGAELATDEMNHEISNKPFQDYEQDECYAEWGIDQDMQHSPIEQTHYESQDPCSVEQDGQHLPVEPTASDINKKRFRLMEQAPEKIHEKEVRLANAVAKLENWDFHCECKRAKLLHQNQDTITDEAQLQCDHGLLIEKTQATRDVIEAARELTETKAYYRAALGHHLYDESQRSQFEDHPDDGPYLGYRETRLAREKKYAAIEKWRDLVKARSETSVEEGIWQPRAVSEEEYCEYWRDAPEAETWESQSLVLPDADRRRIDKWVSVCKELPRRPTEQEAVCVCNIRE